MENYKEYTVRVYENGTKVLYKDGKEYKYDLNMVKQAFRVEYEEGYITYEDCIKAEYLLNLVQDALSYLPWKARKIFLNILE